MLQKLPIDDYLDSARDLLIKSSNLVLTATPGSGKTTRLPAALLKLTDKKILVLEPRRIAASSAASRIAYEQNWYLGEQVGYQIRFENKSKENTRLLFVTEALLLKKMLSDPELKDIGIVILDEFHERSIHTDLAIALLYELQQLQRPDLKIVVMSATLDASTVAKFLGNASILDVPGSKYPLEVFNQKESQLLRTGNDFNQKVVDKIKAALINTKKHILVFLPGLREIQQIHQLLDSLHLSNVLILDLYGSLSIQEQKTVLEPSQKQKIILCTNVAESSITIDQVDTVIDSGLVRKMTWNESSELELKRISKSSAKQRGGRASRQHPGKVYQMWNNFDEMSMQDFDQAEIQQVELSDVLLSLAQFGVRDFLNWSWFEKPSVDKINLSLEKLRMWQALESDNQITEIGKEMLSYPLSARLARVMVQAKKLNAVRFGAEVCSVLSERDIFNVWEQWEAKKFSEKLADHIAKSVKNNSKITAELLEQILAPAYLDRICKRRKTNPNSAIRFGGSGVTVSEKCRNSSDFFLALDLISGIKSGDALATAIYPLSDKWVEENLNSKAKKESKIIYDKDVKKLYKETYLSFQGFPINEPSRSNPSGEEIQEQLSEIAYDSWQEILENNSTLNDWLLRYEFYCKKSNSEFINPALIKEVLQEACIGENSLTSLFSKDLIWFFESKISSVQLFNQNCPKHLTMPNGKYFKINYHLDKNPTVELKLQEAFGLNKNPKIINGTVSITFHLLAPNKRPVQVTEDIEGFWRNSYQEVRKELRARYPKHKWPEDPNA